MNKENAEKLIEWLEETPDSEFDQEVFCGSACCIAGHVWLHVKAPDSSPEKVEEFKRRGEGPPFITSCTDFYTECYEVMQEFLELDKETTEWLWDSTPKWGAWKEVYDDDGELEWIHDNDNTTVKHAIAALQFLIDGGTPETYERPRYEG